MKHPETTSAEMAERLEVGVKRAALELEVMRLAAQVAPTFTAHVVTLSTNSVRRQGAKLGLPLETLDDLLAVPMPTGTDNQRPANWGNTSAALWDAMRETRP